MLTRTRQVEPPRPEPAPLGAELPAPRAAVEILAAGEGARLIFNEQGVYFGQDGWAEREEGTAVGMQQMADWLAANEETV